MEAGPRTSIANIDIASLEACLPELIKKYRDALKFVETLDGLIARRNVLTYRLEGMLPEETTALRQSIAKRDKKSRRFVSGGMVGLFVDAHLRTKLQTILRLLSIERIGAMGDPEAAKKLDFYIHELEQAHKSVSERSKARLWFANSPALASSIAFLAPILVSLVGIDISGSSALGESVANLVQTRGFGYIYQLVLVALLIFLYLYILVAPAAVAFGFRAKRAMFSGGFSEDNVFDWNPYVHERDIAFWPGFPETNIYHLETRVFEVLGARKKPEFPLDFVLSILPYYCWIVAIVLTVSIIGALSAGKAPSVINVLALLAFWFLSVTNAFGAVRNYRLRKADGNL